MLGDSTSRFGMSSALGYLDVFDGRLRGVRVSVGMEDEHLYLLSSVKNDSVQADLELNYAMGDSLQVADARGYVNVRQWDTWGPSLCGEKESFEFDFSGNLKIQEDNNWIRGYRAEPEIREHERGVCHGLREADQYRAGGI